MITLGSPLPFDLNITQTINALHHPIADAVLQAISYLGEYSAVWIILAFAILSSGPRKKQNRDLFFMLIAALALEVFINDGILKNLFYRERPYLTYDFIRQLGLRWETSSLVSGHTAAAFAITWILWKHYRRFFVPALIFSLLTAYSRIYLGMHFFTDVALGMVVGILSGTSINYFCRNKIKR